MAITDLCTYVETNVMTTTTRLRVPADAYELLAAALAEPSHLFAELYTLRYREQIMIYAAETYAGVNYINVQRGMGGDTARAWPDGVCLRVTAQVAGAPCGDPEATEGSGSQLRALLGMLNIGTGLELVEDELGLTLRIAATGVAAADYGGAEVAATGQLLSIPSGWPASAVPAFESCCGETGGGTTAPLSVSVSGIDPDESGDIDLCAHTASSVEADSATQVFVCVGGQLAKTSVGQIIALVTPSAEADLSEFVKRVGGLSAVTHEIDFEDAAVTSSDVGVTALVSTADGVRRMSLSDIAAHADTSISVGTSFDPATCEFTITLNGTAYTTALNPQFSATIAGQTVTLKLGPQTATFNLPSTATTVELSKNGSGQLTVGVNGVSASLQLVTVDAIPINTEAVTGTTYKLIRTAAGEYYFIVDTP